MQFSGRFSGEGVTGTLRMRARRYDRSGKRLRSRCDSGKRAWSAAIAKPLAPAGAPAPAPAPTPAPEPGSPVPGEWSLKMTSDAGDYIGQGQGWSHHPPGDTLAVTGGTGVIGFMIDTPDGGWWSTDFAAPPGQQLHVGTYDGAHRYPFNDQSPGFDHSGMGRGCNESTSTFTITELTYDADLG